MKRENKITSEIKEGCFSGDCEGKCRQLYYDICPIRQKYYIEYVRIKKKVKMRKVWISEENKNE